MNDGKIERAGKRAGSFVHWSARGRTHYLEAEGPARHRFRACRGRSPPHPTAPHSRARMPCGKQQTRKLYSFTFRCGLEECHA